MNVNTVNAILDAISDDTTKIHQIITASGHIFYLNEMKTNGVQQRFDVVVDRDQGLFFLNDKIDTRYGETILQFQDIQTFNFFEEASVLQGQISGADGTKGSGQGSGFWMPDSATYPFPTKAALDAWASNTANWKDLQEDQTILKVDTGNPLTGWYIWRGPDRPKSGEYTYNTNDWLPGDPVIQGQKGQKGDSAYDIAKKGGYTGTQVEWLDSLSAYGVAKKNGYSGTVADWLEQLTAYGIAKEYGFSGTKIEWVESLYGDSAYDAAVKYGFVGTEQQWIDSLKGLSAYDVAKKNGFVGTETEWLESLEGKDAYAIAKENGFVGTFDEWIDSIGFRIINDSKASQKQTFSSDKILKLFLDSGAAKLKGDIELLDDETTKFVGATLADYWINKEDRMLFGNIEIKAGQTVICTDADLDPTLTPIDRATFVDKFAIQDQPSNQSSIIVHNKGQSLATTIIGTPQKLIWDLNAVDQPRKGTKPGEIFIGPVPSYPGHYNENSGSPVGTVQFTQSEAAVVATVASKDTDTDPVYAGPGPWAGTNRKVIKSTAVINFKTDFVVGFGGDSKFKIQLFVADEASVGGTGVKKILDQSFNTNANTSNQIGFMGTFDVTGFIDVGSKFKAKTSVSFDTWKILPGKSHYLKIVLTHTTDQVTDTGLNYIYENELFVDYMGNVDTEGTSQTTEAINIINTPDTTYSYFETLVAGPRNSISGLEYVTQYGTEWRGDDVRNINTFAYTAGNNISVDFSTIGFNAVQFQSASTNANISVLGTPVSPLFQTNYKANGQFSITQLQVVNGQSVVTNGGEQIKTVYTSPWSTAVTDRINNKQVWLYTIPPSSTDLFEGFTDENKRIDSNTFGMWDSTRALNANEALIFNGKLMARNRAYFHSPGLGKGARIFDQPNYIDVNGNTRSSVYATTDPMVQYCRNFVQPSADFYSKAAITLTGTGFQLQSAFLQGRIKMFVTKLAGEGNVNNPAIPLWAHAPRMSGGADGNTQDANGAGCYITVVGNTVNVSFGTNKCKDGINVHLQMAEDIELDSMSVTFAK